MPEVKKYPAGTFCWTELATSDPGAAKTFYTRIFGWETHDDEVGEGMIYTMIMQGGKNVAALYGMNEEMEQANVPVHWLHYVSVDSVDDTAARAKELGAEIPRPAMDVMDLGRMAVLVDPAGANFALWEPKQAIGATLVNEPVSVVWNELMTTDVEKAGTFYSKLFNWGSDVMPMGGGNYTVFKNGDRPAGGMMPITEDMPPMPSNWLVYFSVADTDKTANEATAAGATLLQPPKDVEGVGKIAVLMDPQGAAFGIINSTGPEM